SKASTVKNKGLITEAYEWDKEEVSSDDNEMVEVKVLMALKIMMLSVKNVPEMVNRPVTLRSINHEKYTLFIVDEFLRYTWVYFLKKKSEALETIMSFIKRVKNQNVVKVKQLIIDNGKFDEKANDGYLLGYSLVSKAFWSSILEDNRLKKPIKSHLMKAMMLSNSENLQLTTSTLLLRYLMYLTASRPDIQFATCLCARYQANPKESHLIAVKRIFRKSTSGACQLLRGTKGFYSATMFSTTKVLGVKVFFTSRSSRASTGGTARSSKGREVEVFQVSNEDTAVAQRRLKDKQPEDKHGLLGKGAGKGISDWVEDQEGDPTFEVEPQENVDQGSGLQEVQTQDLMDYQLACDREQHLTCELFGYREDNNEAAFVVAAVEKIYSHNLLTFNNTVAYEVIFKWKARLKDDMDARSDVYVLSNGCRKCSDDNDGYY
nr:uncharacterized mitochondrial protein AtMg00810-like [Tanacetum cinerariifolium]